jgi:hypothetical protein
VLCTALVGALALLAPAAAQASVSVGDVSVTEGNATTTATFTLTRSAGLLAGATSVAFTTVNGSAHAPADYVATSGTRDFPGSLLPATQVQHVAVTIAGDRLDEPDESFRLVVSGAEVAAGNATATILDDDPPPAIAVADAAPATEGATAAFVIRLSAPSGRDVTVAFATANGTATAGQDYTARSGTLTLPAGSTTATVGVPLLDDSADEPSETFELRLSAPGAATLAVPTATATILDNDEPPPVAGASPPAAVPPPGASPTVPAGGSSSPSSPSTTGTRLAISSPRLRQPGSGLVTIACPASAGSCTGQVTLFTRPNKRSQIKELRSERRLGQRTFTLAAGRTLTLTFALSRADRRLLDRAGRVRVRAYAVTKDGSGQTYVRTAGGTLLRRTAHSSPSRTRSAASGERLDAVGGALGAVVGRRPGL